MLNDLLREMSNLPDVWGEGALFAFSGMDGPTNAASGFVVTLAADLGALLFHTPARRTLDVRLGGPARPRVVTGDVIGVETPAGDLLMAFSAWHTLVGLLPQGAACRLALAAGAEAELDGALWVSRDPERGDALAGAQRGARFVLSYGVDAAEARRRVEEAVRLDPAQVARQRLAAYRDLPALTPPAHDRLLKKCFSVMRVNTLSAEAAMRQAWSTPDRVPHKDMWLWDSVFHSFAMNLFRPRLSWEFIKSVLDTENADGFIPHQTSVLGHKSSVTQPPLLAWAVWENSRYLKDRAVLEWALPRLEAYLDWNLANRDRNGNGLLEWFMHGNVRCRCGESGLDNSPRFDCGVYLDAVDFSVIQAHDMLYTARIAAELGRPEAARRWEERSRAMSRRVHDLLWDEAEGFYFDRDMDGRFERVRGVTGFLPLMLDDMSADRAGRLVRTLRDPKRFAVPFPLPTVALDEPSWSRDMWRGCAWANTNYLVIHGLRRRGYRDEAAWIARSTVEHVDRYYQRYGVLFEFFDSRDEVAPPACDRKGPCDGPYDIRRKVSCIRDYHWTAAVTACLLTEGT